MAWLAAPISLSSASSPVCPSAVQQEQAKGQEVRKRGEATNPWGELWPGRIPLPLCLARNSPHPETQTAPGGSD